MIFKKTKPTITITKVGRRWNYFQIFILGFYELERKGEISLRFRCEWPFVLSTYAPKSNRLSAKLRRWNNIYTEDSYNLEGFMEFHGKKKYFCIDSADAPYLFDAESLDAVDFYFKMQCPKHINPDEGFKLCDDIWIPYSDHKHCNPDITKLTTRGERRILTNLSKNLHKVMPLISGFRQLATLNSYKALKDGYDNYMKNASRRPTKKMMCYFGNAQGPKPENDVINPDWDWEADILGYFNERINHPNEKRAIVAKIISSKGKDFDARIISESFADSEKQIRHDELIVPLEDYCSFISDFEYNMNVSGYRMSIPCRFIESFIVGTAIFTDKLSVRWYRPFDEEVIETTEMGYLPNSVVDWNKFEKDVDNLPSVNKQRVLELFNEKWSPEKVAEYIVNTMAE